MIRSLSAKLDAKIDGSLIEDHAKCAHWKGVCRANHPKSSKTSQNALRDEDTAICSFLPVLFSTKATG
jgi:hypothetical protein